MSAILSLELLLPQVEDAANGSATATRELRQAIARGEERRRKREPLRERAGHPGNAGDDLDYARGLADLGALELLAAAKLPKDEIMRILSESSGEHPDTTQRRIDRAIAEMLRRRSKDAKPQK